VFDFECEIATQLIEDDVKRRFEANASAEEDVAAWTSCFDGVLHAAQNGVAQRYCGLLAFAPLTPATD
jgi:hypothetical protein